jgi:hypothetical protein
MTLLGFEGNRGKMMRMGQQKIEREKKKRKCMWKRGILGLA